MPGAAARKRSRSQGLAATPSSTTQIRAGSSRAPHATSTWPWMRRSSIRCRLQLTRARSCAVALDPDAVPALRLQPLRQLARAEAIAVVEVVEEERQVDAGDDHDLAVLARGRGPARVARAAPEVREEQPAVCPALHPRLDRLFEIVARQALVREHGYVLDRADDPLGGAHERGGEIRMRDEERGHPRGVHRIRTGRAHSVSSRTQAFAALFRFMTSSMCWFSFSAGE